MIGESFHHWDDIQVFFKGGQVRSGGHGFCGIGRKRLLNILQERCLELGVNLVFETDVTDDQALAAQYQADLVIASDGLNSRIRTRYAEVYQPDIDLRKCRFVWLGTHQTFDAFTFAFEQTEHGWFQAHAYQFDDDDLDLHHRDAGGGLEGARPRPDGAARGHRLLREAVRQVPGRPFADQQCRRTCAARPTGSASRA